MAWSSTSEPAGGAYSAPTDPLAGFSRSYYGKRRQGRAQESGKGRGRRWLATFKFLNVVDVDIVVVIDIALAAVVDVHATVLSSSSIDVTWHDAPQNNATPIVAYSVHFFPTNPRRPEIQQVVTSTNHVLRNLRPDTEYVIYVMAYAYKGKSKPSSHVTARTLAESINTLTHTQ